VVDFLNETFSQNKPLDLSASYDFILLINFCVKVQKCRSAFIYSSGS